MKKKEIRKLFLAFLRIGAFTFGGGYAMIPLIQKEVVEKEQWISEDDLLEIIAIAESTPGPIAVNAATFVGYKVAGFWGAFFATLGVSLPSFVIILAISHILQIFEQFQPVSNAFVGIRAAVLALILSAFLKLFQGTQKSLFNMAVVAVVFATVAFGKINVLLILFLSAVAGLVHSAWLSHSMPKEQDVHSMPKVQDVHSMPKEQDVHSMPKVQDVHSIPKVQDTGLYETSEEGGTENNKVSQAHQSREEGTS